MECTHKGMCEGGACAKVHMGVHTQRCTWGCRCKGTHRGCSAKVCMGNTMAKVHMGVHVQKHVLGGACAKAHVEV